MFWQDLDPGYYQNPSGFTYLVYALLRVLYGPLGFAFGLPYGNVTEQFSKDPGEIWVAARTLAAVLCMAGVAATYVAGRRLWGVREGLIAAAVLAFAFLPVAYSRVAVTDVGSLAGVALALLWSVRAAQDGRTRDYVLAGAAAGLAVGFKYTAGLVLLALGIAALARLRADRWRALGSLALGGLAAAVVFALLNPYLFGSFGDWWADLRDQADVAANDPKPGQESGGVAYYLDSLTWGLGFAGIGRRARRRGAAAAPRPGARSGAAVPPGRAVCLSRAAVALLRALAPARLPGARAARRGRGGRTRGPGARAASRPQVGRRRSGRGVDRCGDRAAAGRGRPHGRRARARGHAQPGARLSRRSLRARAARVDRAGRARALLSLESGGSRRRRGSPAAPSETAGPSPAGHTRSPAAGVCVRSTSPACSSGPTEACVPRPTRPCSARRSWTTCASTATAT